MKLLLSAAACCFMTSLTSQAADYRLSLSDTGTRDYYCTFTTSLENTSDDTLAELNGYFILLDGEEVVGESRASSFLNTDAGATTNVTFEAPNAPCDAIDTVSFVVGACRIGRSFVDTGECAQQVEVVAPIRDAVPR